MFEKIKRQIYIINFSLPLNFKEVQKVSTNFNKFLIVPIGYYKFVLFRIHLLERNFISQTTL